MELNLQRQTITINEVIYDGTVEQPIECDALLPDYCPDIVGILKCTVTTHVGSTTFGGDRVTVEGTMAAHVYYTDERDCVRHAEYKIPFSRHIELREGAEDPVATVSASVDYVNCRAVNQRRIDIRGAVSLSVKVTDRKEIEVVSDAQGAGLQLRRDLVKATEIVGQVHNTFSVTEDLEIGFGKGAAGSVVRSDTRINLQDYKIIAGKVVVKGEFLLHILYQPLEDEEALEVMEYALPISQIVDCEGIDEECICDVRLMVASCDVQPKSGEDGLYNAFAVDAKLAADVTSHRHIEVPVACDCYSTQYECGCKHREVGFVRLVDVVAETAMHKETLDLPEGVESVLDSWCEVDNVTWKGLEGEMEVSLRLTVSMFARMQDGKCLYFEQEIELEKTLNLKAEVGTLHFEPTADILSSAFSLAGQEKMDIRCEVLIRGCIYSTVKQQAIGEVTVDESQEKKKEANKLYIYYADAGESIWDIAKRYNTSANAIWEENESESDILTEKKMLMIPIV